MEHVIELSPGLSAMFLTMEYNINKNISRAEDVFKKNPSANTFCIKSNKNNKYVYAELRNYSCSYMKFTSFKNKATIYTKQQVVMFMRARTYLSNYQWTVESLN